MPQVGDVSCPTCGAMVAMRISRTGFLQQNVLVRFGIYPWKCGACGSTFLSRNRGQKSSSRRRQDERGSERQEGRA